MTLQFDQILPLVHKLKVHKHYIVPKDLICQKWESTTNDGFIDLNLAISSNHFRNFPLQ